MKVHSGSVFTKAWPGTRYATVIPSNGSVDTQHRAVMNSDPISQEAAFIWPEIYRDLGRFIDTVGNHAFILPVTRQHDTWTIAVPIRRSYKSKPTMELLRQSLTELMMLVECYEIKHVAMPRLCCGIGGLDWESDVHPLFSEFLDSRYTICYEPDIKKPVRVAFKVGAVSKTAQKRMAKK